MIYLLWDIDYQGATSGRLKVSNRPYTPRNGPEVGIPYLAVWERTSAQRWSIIINGLVFEGGVLLSRGMVGPEPAPLIILNRYLSRSVRVRRFNDITDPRFRFEGTATLRMAVTAPTDTGPPDWSEFSAIFTGRIAQKPQKGDSITFHLEPSNSEARKPLLSARFGGTGTEFIFKKPAVIPGNPPAVIGPRFSIRWFGSIAAFFADSDVFKLGTAVKPDMLRLYAGQADKKLKLSVWNGSTNDVYDLHTFPVFDLDSVHWHKVVWDETKQQLYYWFDGALHSTLSIAASAVGTPDRIVYGGPSAGVDFTVYGSLQMWDTSIYRDPDGKVEKDDDTAPIEYPEENLITSYEFEDDQTSTVIADYTNNGRDIDLVLNGFTNPNDYERRGGATGLNGEDGLYNLVIPAVFGNAFMVPGVYYNPDYDLIMFGVANSEIRRMFANGVSLANADVSYSRQLDVFPASGLVRVTPGTATASSVIFGGQLTNGQLIEFFTGPFSGQSVTLRSMNPDPMFLKPEANTVQNDCVLQLEPGSLTGPDSTNTSMVIQSPWDPVGFTGADFVKVSPPPASPYGGNGFMQIYQLRRKQPQPLAANLPGDPTILVGNLPAQPVSQPSVLGNVVSQMLTMYLGWDSSRFTIPDYLDAPEDVGYYVNSDSVTAMDSVNDILGGSYYWTVEGPDGVSELREIKLPTGSPEYTFKQDNVISVKRINRRSTGNKSPVVDAVTCKFKRAWTTIDEGSLPASVESKARAFISQEFRKETAGNINTPNPVPEFTTYLNDRSDAKRKAEKALALVNSETIEIRERHNPRTMFTDFYLGMEVDGDLPFFDFPAFVGFVSKIEYVPLSGVVQVSVTITE